MWCIDVASVSSDDRVLLGAEKSFVYTFEEEGISVRRDIQVSHLTPVSIQSMLSPFLPTIHLLVPPSLPPSLPLSLPPSLPPSSALAFLKSPTGVLCSHCHSPVSNEAVHQGRWQHCSGHSLRQTWCLLHQLPDVRGICRRTHPVPRGVPPEVCLCT